MITSKKTALSITLALSIGAVGCSGKGPDRQDASIQSDLYRPSATSDQDTSAFQPDRRTDEAVSNVFRLNAQALDQLEVTEIDDSNGALKISPLISSERRPSDWVPWHLQALIASFAISPEGVFGSLISEGTPSVKATWIRMDAPQPSVRKTSSSSVSAAPGEASIEPMIRRALATGIVRDAASLRKNLLKISRNFVQISRALEAAKIGNGWNPESYRLELGLGADGQITPVTAAGGSVHFRFDWERGVPAPKAAFASSESDSRITRSMVSFVQAMSGEIRAATAETREISSSGFELDEVRVGIGISAEGDIGLASAEGSVMGSIVFAKAEGESDGPAETPAPTRSKSPRLRKGLARAIRIGSYFAKKSNEASSRQWKLSEIETEFDVGTDGFFGLAQVSGQGVVALGFAKKNI